MEDPNGPSNDDPASMTAEAVVRALYRLCLDREVDQDGLAACLSLLRGGGGFSAVLGGLLASEEYKARVGRDLVPGVDLRGEVFRGSRDDPKLLEWTTPEALTLEQRVAMTLGCRDADRIPKVPGAGMVVEEAGQSVQVMHNGIRVIRDGYGGAWTTRIIEGLRGHHEPQEEVVFHEVVGAMPPGATMLELGGYWSYYSLWFLSGSKDRRAWVIEPDPKNLEVGRENARLNGLSPTFLQGFVGRCEQDAVPFQTERSGIVRVPCISVPAFMDQVGLDTLDLLHCDTQGAELGVLESCCPSFRAGRIGTVFVSTHAGPISGDHLTHQRCLKLVEASGGKVIAEYDVHESFSGDGLIVASFGTGSTALPAVSLSRNRYSASLFRNPLYDLAARDAEQKRGSG